MQPVLDAAEQLLCQDLRPLLRCTTCCRLQPSPNRYIKMCARLHNLHVILAGHLILCMCVQSRMNLIDTCPACAAPSCGDKQTPNYSCAQQKAWGQCTASWLQQGGYCAQTCGYCAAPAPSAGVPSKLASSSRPVPPVHSAAPLRQRVLCYPCVASRVLQCCCCRKLV